MVGSRTAGTTSALSFSSDGLGLPGNRAVAGTPGPAASSGRASEGSYCEMMRSTRPRYSLPKGAVVVSWKGRWGSRGSASTCGGHPTRPLQGAVSKRNASSRPTTGHHAHKNDVWLPLERSSPLAEPWIPLASSRSGAVALLATVSVRAGW